MHIKFASDLIASKTDTTRDHACLASRMGLQHAKLAKHPYLSNCDPTVNWSTRSPGRLPLTSALAPARLALVSSRSPP
jgi:hypothetical protein